MRISGQDVERGTFSHRHAVVHDQKSLGDRYCALPNPNPNPNRYCALLTLTLTRYCALRNLGPGQAQ